MPVFMCCTVRFARERKRRRFVYCYACCSRFEMKSRFGMVFRAKIGFVLCHNIPPKAKQTQLFVRFLYIIFVCVSVCNVRFMYVQVKLYKFLKATRNQPQNDIYANTLYLDPQSADCEFRLNEQGTN